MKENQLIIAIDNSGSTKNVRAYWDNVAYIIKNFDLSRNIRYIFWNSKENPTYFDNEENFDNKEKALDYLGTTDGCTNPSVFIDLISSKKPIELIIITDGAIAPEGYDGHLVVGGKAAVEACIKKCRDLLTVKKISFSGLTTYFLGNAKCMDTSVFAAFVNFLEEGATWKLHLNGEEQCGRYTEVTLDDCKNFDNTIKDLKDYVHMQTFKYEDNNRRDLLFFELEQLEKSLDVLFEEKLCKVLELVKNKVSKKNPLISELKQLEKSLDVLFEEKLFKAIELAKNKITERDLLIFELEQLEKSFNVSLKEKLRANLKFTESKVKDYFTTLSKLKDLNSEEKNIEVSEEDVSRLNNPFQQGKEEAKCNFKKIQENQNKIEVYIDKFKQIENEIKKNSIATLTDRFESSSNFMSEDVYEAMDYFQKILACLDGIGESLQDNAILNEKLIKLTVKQEDIKTLYDLKELVAKLNLLCEEERNLYEARIKELRQLDFQDVKNLAKGKYYLTPCNSILAGYEKLLVHFNKIVKISLDLDNTTFDIDKSVLQAIIKLEKALISPDQVKADKVSIKKSVRNRDKTYYTQVISDIQKITERIGGVVSDLFPFSSAQKVIDTRRKIQNILNDRYADYEKNKKLILKLEEILKENKGDSSKADKKRSLQKAREASFKQEIENALDETKIILEKIKEAMCTVVSKNDTRIEKFNNTLINQAECFEELTTSSKNLMQQSPLSLSEIEKTFIELAKLEIKNSYLQNIGIYDDIKNIKTTFKELLAICYEAEQYGFERFFRTQQAGFTETVACPILLDEDIPVLLLKKSEPIFSNLSKEDQMKYTQNPLLCTDSLKEKLKCSIDHFIGLESAKIITKKSPSKSPMTQAELIGYLAIDNHNRSRLADRTKKTLAELLVGKERVQDIWASVPYQAWLSLFAEVLKEITYFKESEQTKIFISGIRKFCSKKSNADQSLDPSYRFSFEVWQQVMAERWYTHNEENNRFDYSAALTKLDSLNYPYNKEDTHRKLLYWRIVNWILLEKEHNPLKFSRWLPSFYQDAQMLPNKERCLFDGASPLSDKTLKSIQFFYKEANDVAISPCVALSSQVTAKENGYLNATIFPDGYCASVVLEKEPSSSSMSLSLAEVLFLERLAVVGQSIEVPVTISEQSIPKAAVNYGYTKQVAGQMKEALQKNDAIGLLTMRPPLEVKIEGQLTPYEKQAEASYGLLVDQCSVYAHFIEFVKQYEKFPFNGDNKDLFIAFIAQCESEVKDNKDKQKPKRNTLPKREYFDIIIDRVFSTYELAINKLPSVAMLKEIFQNVNKENEGMFYEDLIGKLKGVQDNSPKLFNLLAEKSSSRIDRLRLEELAEANQLEIVVLPEGEVKKVETNQVQRKHSSALGYSGHRFYPAKSNDETMTPLSSPLNKLSGGGK